MAPSKHVVLIQYPGFTRRTTLSPPCGKVHMALRFKRVDFEVRNMYAPQQVTRYNPRGRLPAMILDGETIVDSTDIVTRLEREFPEPPLEPADPLERARGKILEDWADETLYFYGVWLRWCMPGNYRRMKTEVLSSLPAPIRWIVPLIARRTVRRRALFQGVGLKDETTVRREIAECFAAIVQMLRGRSFLCGERSSRADLAVASILDQLDVPRLTPGVSAELAGMPEIVAWRSRVHQDAPSAVVEPGTPQKTSVS